MAESVTIYDDHPREPPKEVVREVLAALRAVYRGDVVEFKIVRTRRGVDVLRTTKQRRPL